MHSAVDVAYRMLQLAKEKDILLSNLQLQKLVYIAHGYLLAWKEKPLFDDEVSAWKYGPVIHEVYNQFKNYGADKINVENVELVAVGFHDDDIDETLNGVLDLYGKHDAVTLVNLTHAEKTPWDKIWNKENGKRQLFTEIPTQLIKNHYRQVISDPAQVSGL